MEKRPKGITIIGWLHLVYAYIGFALLGIVFIASVIATLIRISAPSESAMRDIWSIYLNPTYFSGVVTFIVSFVIGRGLLSLKNFARVLAIWMSLYNVAYGITFLSVTRISWGAYPANVSIAVHILTGLIYIIIIYYLTRPKVKEQFK